MPHRDDEFLSCFDENDRVLVALSGGADSVCLLHMLINSSLNLKVYACHVNHNLRGNESIRDLDFVKALCQKLDIKLFIKEAFINKLAKKEKLSIEECARKVRYEYFNEIANKVDAKIATAHTLSDNAETLLFNLTRGSGSNGLCGIPKARDNIVRPILYISRGDVLDYCKENNLTYVTDSTNAMTIYNRNKIRHEVIPVLKEINPSFEQNIKNFIEIINFEQDFILTQALKLYEKAKVSGGIDINTLKDEHMALKTKVAMLFLSENSFEVNAVNIYSFVDIIDGNIKKFNISKDIFICQKEDKIIVHVEEGEENYFEFPFIEGELESKMGILYKIEVKKSKIHQKFYISTKNVYEFFMDYDKICGNSKIRQRLPSDKIKLSDKNHTKSLKKLFNEEKIPLSHRKKLFVIADEKGVIAVENFGVDKRVACDENTEKFYHIMIKDK